MKLAFCLFKYFPFGGMQRDFLCIARECLARGHEVHVFTMSWEGDHEPGFILHLLKGRGWQNHSRMLSYITQLQVALKNESYDVVIGFNKMPGLDVYYAADVCYQKRALEKHAWWYRFSPRYRQLVALEKAVFKQGGQTEILAISPYTQPEFQYYYQTEPHRFHLLPPGIAKDRLAPANAAEIRGALRKQFNVSEDHFLLLMVGSGFKTKGLDRAIMALAALPLTLKKRCKLFIVGQDNADKFIQLAKTATVEQYLHFLGGRNDVPDFLLAADLLLHPAYYENTGTVLLEALAAGLPVITVDVCGYAHYVKSAEAGIVLPSPFSQAAFNVALNQALTTNERVKWQQKGNYFAKNTDIYSMPIKAADIIVEKHQQLFFKFNNLMNMTGEQFRLQPGRQTWRVKINQAHYFLKQHTGVGWREIFKNLLQAKMPILGARNEQQALITLHALGINAPNVISYGEKGYNPARLQSYILLEEIAPAISLEDLTKDWASHPPLPALKFRLIQEVAKITKRMHEGGITHRDFYICHFLLHHRNNKLYLIDLHRALIYKRLPERWIIKDLAGLYFSSLHTALKPRDYFRFMKYYRGMPLRSILQNEKNRWRKVLMRGEQLYREHN